MNSHVAFYQTAAQLSALFAIVLGVQSGEFLSRPDFKWYLGLGFWLLFAIPVILAVLALAGSVPDASLVREVIAFCLGVDLFVIAVFMLVRPSQD
jgi:hypothetical protein